MNIKLIRFYTTITQSISKLSTCATMKGFEGRQFKTNVLTDMVEKFFFVAWGYKKKLKLF